MAGESILGFDIGGTKTAVVSGLPDGTVLARHAFPTEPERGAERVVEQMEAAARELLRGAGHAPAAVSVSIGGPLDVLQGIVKSPPNLPGWRDVPLKAMLARRFALPVYVEHDGNAGALAEWHFGAGRGFGSIVFLTMGTGCGAGLILQGKLYRGHTDTAGEIGHIRIADDGPACYGKRGSLEGYASGTGIARLAHEMFPELWSASATAREVTEAMDQGSPQAGAVLARAALHVGRGLAMLVDMLNPERIILGGLGIRMWDQLIRPALQEGAREALPDPWKACAVVPAELGESIGDVAALCAAIDQQAGPAAGDGA